MKKGTLIPLLWSDDMVYATQITLVVYVLNGMVIGCCYIIAGRASFETPKKKEG